MWNRIKNHLVDDWKQAYRWLSVQIAFVWLLLEGAYEFSPEIQGYFPEHWRPFIGGAIILARLVQQQKKEQK